MTDLANKFLAFVDEVQGERWIGSKAFYIFCSAHQLDVRQMTNLRTYLEAKGVL